MEHSLNDILEKVYELEGLLLLARSREQDNIDASLRQLILAKGETIEALLGDTFAENEISVVEMPEPESDELYYESWLWFFRHARKQTVKASSGKGSVNNE